MFKKIKIHIGEIEYMRIGYLVVTVILFNQS